jgi:hypothetical protein
MKLGEKGFLFVQQILQCARGIWISLTRLVVRFHDLVNFFLVSQLPQKVLVSLIVVKSNAKIKSCFFYQGLATILDKRGRV